MIGIHQARVTGYASKMLSALMIGNPSVMAYAISIRSNGSR